MLIFLGGSFMENIHAGHRNRLRDKAFKQGIDSLEDHEILELMLSYVVPYKDMNPIAHILLKKFGTIHRVLTMPVEELMTVKGVGEKTAKYLVSLGQFSQYYHVFNVKEEKVKISSVYQAVYYCAKLVQRLENEEFYVICLAGDSSVKCFERFSRGTSNETGFYLKNVVQYILKNNCSNILLCHNHPHGSQEPSQNDLKITKNLFLALAFHGIVMVDHIIVGENGQNFSFAQHAILDGWKEEVKSLISADQYLQWKASNMQYDLGM